MAQILRIACVAAAAVLASLLPLSAVSAQGAPDWPRERIARFAAYSAAHRDVAAERAYIRKRTAALVAAAPAFAEVGHDDRPPLIWRVDGVKSLWDGVDFPELVVVPAGEFTMGSPETEAHRRVDEGPRHRVRIGYALAISRYPVTVAEFARFVAATGHDMGNSCKTFEDGAWDDHRPGRTWRTPGYAQSDSDPAICIDWDDAQAYVAWISKRTGHAYRLLSEAEYEYANRAGTTTAYWWGDALGTNHAACDGCGMAIAGTETSPVGRFAPNPFGLYDTTGNAWSWVSDCWNTGYATAPADGSPNLSGDCTAHAQRGGAWYYIPGNLRSAIRVHDEATLRNYHNTFRVSLVL